MTEKTHWIDAAISNARNGYCMCGSSEGVRRGRSPFGYGPCCIDCQRNWEKAHGVRWASEDECRAVDDAVADRLRSEGVDGGEIITRRNHRLPPFISDHGGICGPLIEGRCRYFGRTQVPR